nr:transposase [Amycolatopsis decaplanina]
MPGRSGSAAGRAGRAGHRRQQPGPLRREAAFVIFPKRWVVERTFSWITQARRNVHDYERLPPHSAAFINLS